MPSTRCGRLDVLVNNAGIGGKVALEDEPLDDFRATMEVNVTAIWHLCKLLADGARSPTAAAASSTSPRCSATSASTPVKQASYCASKGAVVNLTRELALQFARRNVRVNALCPGWFQSELTAGMETDEGAHRVHQGQQPDAADGRRATSSTAPCCCWRRRPARS